MNRDKQQQRVALLAALTSRYPLGAVVFGATLGTIASALLLTSGTAQSNQPKTNLTPASTVGTKQTVTANLPAQKLPVPGWLGFATVPANGIHRYPWSPSHRDGQVVIFSEDWTNVKPGKRLVAISPGIKSSAIKQDVTFLRSSKELYGCDGVPTTMASFSSQNSLPEGAVWVLPPAAAANATAVPVLEQSLDQVPTNLLPPSQRQRGSARAWKVGSGTILLQKQGKYKVKLTLAMNNRVVYTQQAEKYAFGDQGNLKPVNVSQPEPGIPQALGAFQLQAGQPPVIVLWVPGYEGNSFDILVPEGNSVKRFQTEGIYFCAY